MKSIGDEIHRLREMYRPAKIDLLFVAESPPYTKGKTLRFFYKPDEERWDHLYKSLMTAVFSEFEFARGEKDIWLRRFMQRGCFLTDATDEPINHIKGAARRRALDSAIPDALRRIGKLVSTRTPIVLIKKSVFQALNAPLRGAGHSVIHESFLPFPSHGHQARFIDACRSCLRRAPMEL
jgi:hypothetical protein